MTRKSKIQIPLILLIIICLLSTIDLNAQNTSIQNDKFTLNFNMEKGTWSANTHDDEKIISNAEFLIITDKGDKYYSSSTNYKKSLSKSFVSNEMGKG